MLSIINLILGGGLLVAGRKLFWLFVGAAGFLTGIQLADRFWQGPELLAIIIGLVIGIIFALLAIFLQGLVIGAAGFLIGGYIDRGLDLIQHVLERVDLSVARSPRTAMLRLLWRRARLGWRGLQFVPRHAGEIDPDVLVRLDTCWAAATGLGLVDVIRGSDFIAWHLHLALDAG